ncbi:MAG: PCMD domain-containing protein [Bacteroidales bacterium]
MRKILILFVSACLFFSCNDDESSNAEIVGFSITNFSNEALVLKNIEINSELNKVYIFLDNDLTLHSFPIELTGDIQLSSGAKTNSVTNGELNFSSPDEVKHIMVEAEDGTQKDWYLFLIHKQIQNSDFETWFTNVGMNGKEYTEIGNSSVESLWSTANMGTSMYTTYGTQPVHDGSETLVQIKTDSNKQIPITAGTLFTGRFDIAGAIANPTDPKKATKFGIPFRHKPVAMQIKFKYLAGENYIQATLNDPDNIFGGFTVTEIDGEDQCSIYAILENRDNDEIIEIARAELTTTTTSDVLTETIIPFEYTTNDTPTHITVVFTSSKGGDLWKGAVGSTLAIDKLEMVY